MIDRERNSATSEGIIYSHIITQRYVPLSRILDVCQGWCFLPSRYLYPWLCCETRNKENIVIFHNFLILAKCFINIWFHCHCHSFLLPSWIGQYIDEFSAFLSWKFDLIVSNDRMFIGYVLFSYLSNSWCRGYDCAHEPRHYFVTIENAIACIQKWKTCWNIFVHVSSLSISPKINFDRGSDDHLKIVCLIKLIYFYSLRPLTRLDEQENAKC